MSHMDVIQGVDSTRVRWTPGIVIKLLCTVLVASSTPITVCIVAILIRGITVVIGCLESPLIGLNDVVLRAEGSSHLIGITVVLVLLTLSVGTVCVVGWHAHHVESEDAATLTVLQTSI